MIDRFNHRRSLSRSTREKNFSNVCMQGARSIVIYKDPHYDNDNVSPSKRRAIKLDDAREQQSRAIVRSINENRLLLHNMRLASARLSPGTRPTGAISISRDAISTGPAYRGHLIDNSFNCVVPHVVKFYARDPDASRRYFNESYESQLRPGN